MKGDPAKVLCILRDHPEVNVNWKYPLVRDSSPLILATDSDNQGVIEILLGHPAIAINERDSCGDTPLMLACRKELTGGTLQLLLKDSRLLVNEPDGCGCTPLRWAACSGSLTVIRWMIALRGDLDLGRQSCEYTDAIGEARWRGRKEVVDLLERYKQDAEGTRHVVRAQLRYYDELASEVFALVVFLSEGLLRARSHLVPPRLRNIRRFFCIASQLPLELQMLLCHRVVRSGRNIISTLQVELALVKLTSIL